MPTHRFRSLRGVLSHMEVDGPSLRDATLKDPTRRQVAVYVPPDASAGGAKLPLLIALAPYTSSGLKLTAWQAFGESLPARVDRLIEEGAMPPAVVAMPDTFTSLGGNQFIDSPVMGRWSTWLAHDLLPALEAVLPAGGTPRLRGLFGRSSGAYGALVNAMLHPDVWGAVAAHSGDVDFDLLYRPELPKAVQALARFDGDIAAFLAHLREQPKLGGKDFYALMMVAMAASYDPRPDEPVGARLPVDPHTCELDPDAWARWLRWDPLRLLDEPAHVDALRSLSLLFIDCGRHDEYHLHFGNRQLASRLQAEGVPHVYEEFDGGHSGVDHRLDRSLPAMVTAMLGH